MDSIIPTNCSVAHFSLLYQKNKTFVALTFGSKVSQSVGSVKYKILFTNFAMRPNHKRLFAFEK